MKGVVQNVTLEISRTREITTATGVRELRCRAVGHLNRRDFGSRRERRRSRGIGEDSCEHPRGSRRVHRRRDRDLTLRGGSRALSPGRHRSAPWAQRVAAGAQRVEQQRGRCCSTRSRCRPPRPGKSPAARAAAEAHGALLGGDRFPSARECRSCHLNHYEEWSVSQHAYAQMSPVFNAMHGEILKRTNGTLGDFCIRCHTPIGMQTGEPLFISNLERSQPAREGVQLRRLPPRAQALRQGQRPHGSSRRRHRGPGEWTQRQPRTAPRPGRAGCLPPRLAGRADPRHPHGRRRVRDHPHVRLLRHLP